MGRNPRPIQPLYLVGPPRVRWWERNRMPLNIAPIWWWISIVAFIIILSMVLS